MPEQDIDDVANDTWVRVLQALPRRQDGKVKAWVWTIATNVVRDGIKKRRAGPLGMEDPPEPEPEPPPEPHPRLKGCLERLKQDSPKFYNAVIAVYYELQPQDEAAATLGVEPGTFRTQLFKGREKLRVCLGDEHP